MGTRVYETTVGPRSAAVGGGWRLTLLEDGEEVGGGVFPAGPRGYIDAREEADAWLFSREQDVSTGARS